MHFLWASQRKAIAARSWCCTMLAFSFCVAFPPHENSSLSRQLNWTRVIYVGCAERKGFVRFQGGCGTLRVRNSLAETRGIAILSLNLPAYDQTWPRFAFAAWLPGLWSCDLETKGSKSNQWASFNEELVMYSPLAHYLNVADAKTCPCAFLFAQGSANGTQLFNSLGDTVWGTLLANKNGSPPLLPDRKSVGKSNPFNWWRVLFDSINLFCP